MLAVLVLDVQAVEQRGLVGELIRECLVHGVLRPAVVGREARGRRVEVRHGDCLAEPVAYAGNSCRARSTASSQRDHEGGPLGRAPRTDGPACAKSRGASADGTVGAQTSRDHDGAGFTHVPWFAGRSAAPYRRPRTATISCRMLS